MTRYLYIFDLDGTLALIDHRRPILDELPNKNRWNDFYRACVRDDPNVPVISVMHALSLNYEIQIWSGRSEIVRKETEEWLMKNTWLTSFNLAKPNMLRMRPENDLTPDQVLKEQWLLDMSVHDRERLLGVFDDRQKVVDLWRKHGITCFQVAPGDF